jgi:hypothetical protein
MARCRVIGEAHDRRSAAKPKMSLRSNHFVRMGIFPNLPKPFVLLDILVDEKGFEPSASSLRTRRSPS